MINHWLRRQIDQKMSSNLFLDMNLLDAYFINKTYSPGKLTFVNASFWGKRAAWLRRPFKFDLKTYPPCTNLREVSRVSSLILRAKPWLAKKVLRHGNRFAARVRRRYFSEGEKRRLKMRLLFAGYGSIVCFQKTLWLDNLPPSVLVWVRTLTAFAGSWSIFLIK